MNADPAVSTDITSLVKRFQYERYGKKYVYLPEEPDKKNERLLVILSAHNQGEKYMALRAFTEDQRCDLLFMHNPENTWYLDHDTGASYRAVLEEVIKDYNVQNVYFFGSSMSGYASVLFSLMFNANAVTVNPQINLSISKDYAWDELRRHIDAIPGDRISLEEWCVHHWQESVVYLMHGHDDMDVINARLLLNAMPPRRKVIVQTLDLDSHTMFFGKDIKRVYDVIALAGMYRKMADPGIESAVGKADLTRKTLRRKRRNALCLCDPYRDVPLNDNVIWHRRHLYEDPGRVVYFKDVGLYSADGRLSGAVCQFDGRRWRLISPAPSAEDNIISDWSFIQDVSVSNPVDNQMIMPDAWWIRNNALSAIDITCRDGVATVKIHNANSKNIYLALSLNKEKTGLQFYADTEKRYLTFFAELSTTRGHVNLALGGVSDNGYHHRNSRSHDSVGFAHHVVFEQFFDINTAHREPVFIRINLCPDGQNKTVKIKNPVLVSGYFPMGM